MSHLSKSYKYWNVIKLFDVKFFQVIFGVYNQQEKSRLQGGMCSQFFFKLNSFYCRMMYINQHYKKYVVFLDNNKKKRLNTFLKQLDFVVFSKHYYRRKWCICWGLFSGVDEHIWWSRWCISFSKMCLKDFVKRNCVHGNEWNMSQCNSVAHWWRLQNTVIVLIM